MKNWGYYLLLAVIIILTVRFYEKRSTDASLEVTTPDSFAAAASSSPDDSENQNKLTTISKPENPKPISVQSTVSTPLQQSAKPQFNAVRGQRPPLEKRHLAHFVIEDGVAVTEGDIVLGEPVGGDGSGTGYAVTPDMHLWPTHEIPLFVQPSVVDPDRVQQAVALFSGTAVRFVAYADQTDAVVFEQGTGACKSYVGHVGGKQPLWISPNCGPPEIAHELMHALGFVHEQNRTDRDGSIQLLPGNIDEAYKDNFVKLPQDFMVISGLSPFDFNSIMIYPTSMFSKNGEPTMQSLIKGRAINPSRTLSTDDVNRVNQVYSHR